MLRKNLAIGAAGLALLAGGYAAASAGQDEPAEMPRAAEMPLGAPGDEGETVPNEVIVVYKDNATLQEQDSAKDSVEAVDTRDLDENNVSGTQTELVELPNDVSTAEAIVELSTDPAVEIVEPNWLLAPVATSDDPSYLDGSLWGVYGDTTAPANAFGSQAAEVWDTTTTGDNTIVIGVIDEGVQITHPDLAANIWVNPADPVDGADNDGNGYIDDVNGWDFELEDNAVYKGLFDDHGTHVAGTIGAVGGNAQGIAGMAWDVKIVTGRFLGSGGTGTTADAIEAINYMTDLKANRGINLVATSNSWGCLGGGCYSAALEAAITAGGDEDILFIAAAGNDSVDTDITPHYPSSYDCPANSAASGAYDCIISVAAIDNAGGLAGFSNWGALSVDIGAPGVSILSTEPSNAYGYKNGTSMATPHVTGAAVLYKATTPALSATAIKNNILTSVAATTSLVGNVVTDGRLDLSDLAGLTTPPPVGQVTVCHATETLAPVGPNFDGQGLFLSYSKVFVGRSSAGEDTHADHPYDWMWLTGAASPPPDCPSPGN